jgi:hypothetical protein
MSKSEKNSLRSGYWLMPQPEFDLLIKRNATRVDKRTIRWEPKGKEGIFHTASVYVVDSLTVIYFPHDPKQVQTVKATFTYYTRYKDKVWRSTKSLEVADLLKSLRRKYSK